MVDQIAIIAELGPNADLLLESDQWLDNKRKELATELTTLSNQFDRILRAIKFKRQIQQNNNVPVRLIERDDLGNIKDMSIQIVPVVEAIRLLRSYASTIDTVNEATQYNTWILDGYDVQTCIQMASAS